jgi:proteasome lid subunit RPN8/RPN11
MDDDIQFGEVEHAAPEGALRPDRNRHFAVVPYGDPAESELPIFVDLDVVRDMEEHALSDTSVELGGVLLGGTHVDEEGRPFVVITDSLRAQHYESTKGSFTFTHDTWSAITREREQFPPELQMVGWYHTHPDWGVFLSGMDMFICDNFFNKPLDVAYVIDPCRGDRAMFQWTGDALTQRERERIRRTSGFFVTASRFRAEELEYYVAELSGTMPATTPRSAPGSFGAPVVHLHQPQAPPPPPWQAPAILGGLALQFLLVALIAWKTLAPPDSAASNQQDLAAAIKDLNESFEARQALSIAEERLRTQQATMDQVVGALRGPGDNFSELQAQIDQAARLEGDVAARDAHIRVQSADLAYVRNVL